MFLHENEAEERRTSFIKSKISMFENYSFLALCGLSFALIQAVSYLVLLVPLTKIVGYILIPMFILVPGIYGFRDTENKDFKYLFLSGLNIVSLIASWRHLLQQLDNTFLIFAGALVLVIVCIGMGVKKR